ncbi:hypothetical protein BLA23254_07056 [Burkholderia lata]|uniref:Uncharacterized protein n=1 Tax=Burkholderia lata (strain ATCC 17760 / DSM 23089 / LMG 22485 / NCIMB 9086 / R18194 / 383) TaxID=482957 RepID=A0A6P2SDV9_BURL3|nr:hypothetical protein [Burkholderia lata]VWC42146.1 hypothetical protein BLA23254_07056 [Burkholderia lata]
MKSARRLLRISSLVVACGWTLPVLIFSWYIVWSLVPFFKDDNSSGIVWLIQTAAYFCMRSTTGIWTSEWRFLPITLGDLSLVEWGILYFYGVVIDLVLATLVLHIGYALTLGLNRCAFVLAFRVHRARARA